MTSIARSNAGFPMLEGAIEQATEHIGTARLWTRKAAYAGLGAVLGIPLFLTNDEGVWAHSLEPYPGGAVVQDVGKHVSLGIVLTVGIGEVASRLGFSDEASRRIAIGGTTTIGVVLEGLGHYLQAKNYSVPSGLDMFVSTDASIVDVGANVLVAVAASPATPLTEAVQVEQSPI